MQRLSSTLILVLSLSACLPPRTYGDDMPGEQESRLIDLPNTEVKAISGTWVAVTPDALTAYNDVTKDTRTIVLSNDGGLVYKMSAQDGPSHGGCLGEVVIRGTARPSDGRLNAVFSDGARSTSGCTDSSQNRETPLDATELTVHNAVLAGYDYFMATGNEAKSKLAIGVLLTREGDSESLLGTWTSGLFPYGNPSPFASPNPTMRWSYTFSEHNALALSYATLYANSYTFQGDVPTNRLAGCTLSSDSVGTYTVEGNTLSLSTTQATQSYENCSVTQALNGTSSSNNPGFANTGYFLRSKRALVIGSFWSYFGVPFVKQ